MSELRALTSLRGIAAWLVVLYHIRGSIAGLPAAMEAVFAKGYLAVDFFFLLSGFVIWLTWHDRMREPGAIPHFLQKRVARIWPLHAAMLAFAVALALILNATGRNDPAFPFAELPLHLLLIQNWGFTDTLRWNDPAWSISCELAAYLLFPLLMRAIDWRTLPTIVLVAIAAAVLAALHFAMEGAASLGDDIPRHGLVRCLTEFTAGTVLSAIFLRTRNSCNTSIGRQGPWLAPERRTVTAATLCAAAAVTAWVMGAPETLAVPAAFSGLLLTIALTSGDRANPFEGRMLHYLGQISYATYLSHFLLWKAFKLPLASASVPPWQIACYLVLVFVASIALYHTVERPAQRRINALSIRRHAAV
ncbi:peptidoglycan/LPS O-acetylase OafA/YrhL [Sphingomonas insulae]|uniref:Acyltransferase n=1 Tax=Sphingomonas insulae TaxID=424800 RepID=A0ABN1HUD9_9SPHN|nr:acyltransferase [Sphingomonas insulae]NIJ28296.1 peptidoglycan/LPS O-acetylase OafA/YrhL [Sphingomonas insulae]